MWILIDSWQLFFQMFYRTNLLDKITLIKADYFSTFFFYKKKTDISPPFSYHLNKPLYLSIQFLGIYRLCRNICFLFCYHHWQERLSEIYIEHISNRLMSFHFRLEPGEKTKIYWSVHNFFIFLSIYEPGSMARNKLWIKFSRKYKMFDNFLWTFTMILVHLYLHLMCKCKMPKTYFCVFFSMISRNCLMNHFQKRIKKCQV